MARDGNRRPSDVVGVVSFGELMAQARGGILDARTVPARVRRIRRIHFHFYGIEARRHDRLAVASVEDEVLTTKLEDISVSPSRAHALKAVPGRRATAAIRPGAVAIVDVVWVRVEHAEATLR